MRAFIFIIAASCLISGRAESAETGGLGQPVTVVNESNGKQLTLPGLAQPQAAVDPSDLAQLSLELLNRARANPAAEAASFGIDLNEGLTADTISSDPKQPLAFNPYIIDAANLHSQWQLDTNTFSHTGDGGTNPGQRMSAAGYDFHGSSTWGENIAWQGSTGSPNAQSYVVQQHESLFVDEGISSRGHRLNMLNADFREIGIGVQQGPFTHSNGTTYNAVMQTQDFAATGIGSDPVFITGVVYDDSISNDNFYTPGEGWGGVSIEILDPSNGSVVASTSSWSSGGYRVAVADGSYTLRASGGGLGGIAYHTGIVVAGRNVKVDIDPASASNHRRIRLRLIPGHDWAIEPSAPSQSSDATHQSYSNLDPAVDHSCALNPDGAG